MHTEVLAEQLAQNFEGFSFVVENKKVVSNMLTEGHCYRLEVEERASENGVFFEVSIIFGYTEGVFFDFKGVAPVCKVALFDLQAAVAFGRLELRPLGKLLAVSLRELVWFTLDMYSNLQDDDDDDDEDLPPSREECAALELGDSIGRLLLQAYEIKDLLRSISIGEKVDQNLINLLRESRSRAGFFGLLS